MQLRMGKSIKKIVRYLVILFAVLIIVPASLVLLARTPKFQTFIVHRFSGYFSNKMGVQISVGKVSYTFFNKLVLYDILIKDQNLDTLLSARQVALRIREFNTSENRFTIGKMEVYEPDFRMIQDTTGKLNLSWFLDALKSDKTQDTTKKSDITISDIAIYDGSYSLIDLNDTVLNSRGLINFKNLRVSSLNTMIEEMVIIPDSVRFSVRAMAFKESSGFSISALDMNTVIKKNSLFFTGIDMITDSSHITANKISILPRDSSAYSDFINRVRLDVLLKRSVLSTSDLAYFVGSLKGVNEIFHLSGRVTGTVAEMRGRDIEFEYSSATRLNCDFDVSGLPSIEDMYIYIDFTDLRTNATDLENFSLPGKGPLLLPALLHDLGQISFRGSFTGFVTDFVAFGTLETERGSFSTDLSLRPDEKNMFRFKGLLKASNFDLGYISRNNELFGGLWLHAQVDGSMISFKHLSATIDGVIDSVQINDYLYRNVSLAGKYTEKVWDGNVTVRDKNMNMDILGRFDLSNTLPEFDFTMNLAHADLYKLKLQDKDTLYKASALLTANFKGNNIDNLDGDLRLINSTLRNSNGNITIYDFLVRSGRENGVPLLTIRSDFADGEVRGQHTYASIGTAVKTMIARLFPTRFVMPATPEKLKENNFTFNARIKKINRLNDFFSTGLSVADGSLLSGFFFADSSKISTSLKSAELGFKGITLSNLIVKSSVAGGRMSISLTSDSLMLPDKSELKNFALELGSHPDTMNLRIKWDNKNAGMTMGEIMASGFYSLNQKNKPLLTISLLPTEFVVNNSPWKINPAHIVIDTTSLSFDNLLVNSQTNYLRLDGKLSSNPGDKLTFSFEGLNLSYLNNISKKNEKKEDGGALEINFGGIMNGTITLSDVFDDFLFESDVTVNDFLLNNSPYGKVTLRSEWDPQRKLAVINVMNDYLGSKYFDINGTYSPTLKVADITAFASRMPLNVLNSIVKSFASDVRGVGSGKVRLNGKLNQLFLTGSIFAEGASMKVDFLQTRYSFTDSVRFTKKGIEFRNVKLYDEKKNQGVLNGILAHRSFKDFRLDLNFDLKNVMCLNTKPKDSDIFYGTAYASGYVGIKGGVDKLSFNISAKTERNTSFSIPLSESATVSDYPFIIFVDSKREDEAAKARESMFIKNEKASNMELNFDLDVTPDAEVELIMDSKAGDVIKGTGSGKLNISMSSKGDVKMSGVYTIENGDYLFTLGDILNKRFSVEEGGTITWNGNLTDALINIRAIYRLKTSLYDIFPDEAFRERIPVECQLNLSEKLMNPVIGFDIYLPTADDETREYLKMAINTQEELSRQFLYLLVMNSFYPDPSLFSAVPQSSTQGAAALGVTTTEMLSNQFSNWLSQISNDFDIGFNYRPGNEITPQELEVAMSTQLLNDKVVLNGNFDVGGKQSNTQASNISGDFDIEFKITEKLRFKVFNRSNNNLFYETAPYTQGFGIFLRRDFDRLKDLFIRPDNKKKKKVNSEGNQKEE